MICFERTEHRIVRILGPAAEIVTFGKAMEKTGQVFVDYGLSCTQGTIWFEPGSPLLSLLRPVGEVWMDGSAQEALAGGVRHGTSEAEDYQELERQAAYTDWAEQRYAAARGLA